MIKMNDPTQVQDAWKTTDGKLWPTFDSAMFNQQVIDLAAELNEVMSTDIDPEPLARWLVENYDLKPKLYSCPQRQSS